MRHEKQATLMGKIWTESQIAFGGGQICGVMDEEAGKTYCAYWREGESPDRCVVGRYLKDPKGVEDKLCGGFGSRGGPGDGELKKGYRGLPVKFWMQLQRWHDAPEDRDAQGRGLREYIKAWAA